MLAVLASAVAAGGAGAGAASAAEQQAYSAALNYATPALAVGQGDTLKLTNLDTLAEHDLDSEQGLFESDLAGAGESVPVRGVEKLSPGTYQFHCTLHSWMRGALTVAPAGGGETPGLTTPDGLPGLEGNAPDPIDLVPQAEVSALGDGEWPLYGKDVGGSRNGGTAGPSLAEVPTLGPVWSYWSRKGDFTGTPVVAKNTLVAGTNKGWVHALNATTGKVKWTRDVGAPVNGTAAIAGDRVIVPVARTDAPRLVALDRATGRVLWETVLDTQKNADVYGSPTVAGDTVYMGVSALFGETGDPAVSVRGAVVALDVRTGSVRWKTYMVPEGHDGGSVWTTPAVDVTAGRVFVGTGNAYHEPAADTTDSMVALDARTGAIVDHFQATAGDVWNGTENRFGAGPDHDFGASPQLLEGAGGRRLVGEGQKSGTYWALDRQTMDPVWSAMTAPPGIFVGGIVGSTATDGTRVYGPDTIGGEQWALDMAGRHAWLSSDVGPLHFNATSTANGVVYNTDMTGHLTAREAATGAVLAKIPLGSPSWAGVAIAGGSVFTATGTQGGSGYLVAYRPRKELGGGGYANEGDEPRMEGVKKGECTPTETVKRRVLSTRKVKRKGKRRRGPDAIRRVVEHVTRGIDARNFLRGYDLESIRRANRFVPKPVGTKEKRTFYFGQYVVPPGQDLNRADVELPVNGGMLLSVEPSMRRVSDMSEPSHMEGHIHHAHWFALDPGNKEDNYTQGNTEWVFGNGDEETRGDFQERTAADPHGPVYGAYIKRGNPQLMIYMLHNKTAAPLEVYIMLDVTFLHGTPEELTKKTGRPHHDVSGVLFGRTYDVPRDPGGDGVHEYAKESGKVVEWTSTVDGTIIGMGGHLHPGGINLTVENYGPKEHPCPDDGRGYGGTMMYRGDAINRVTPLSEDFQMEVTNPGFRAPIHKGDRLRISATYENKDHAWYAVMQHLGVYVDEHQPPRGRCRTEIVGPAGERSVRTEKVTRTKTERSCRTVRRKGSKKRRRVCTRRVVRERVRRVVTTLPADPAEGVPNRPWRFHPDPLCGLKGLEACDLPEDGEPRPVATDRVTIANFSYVPGNRTAGSSDPGEIAVVPRGTSLTFVNADQAAGIRHSVTTCPWPCNGQYVGNYPQPDGRWHSGTMGHDPIDGGSTNPVAQTPKDLPPGKYAYFCVIHPWMRGAFKVE
ncbi:MAG: PQQ-binding-like beta-propeller repeat protein [Solirubrobacterales bacterium]|nr:PQQ-binding-like beta-propeller repeat protein [Solirubrobacterales bacterium]